jgi:glycosyltransferase involved in cell wall biosynthesis
MIVYLFPATLDAKIISNQKRKLKWVKKESAFILASSETTRQDIIKFLEIDPAKVKTIPLAASPIFKPQSDEKINEVLDKYRIKKPYILSVGTQEPRKNIALLVEVFEHVYQQRPKASLVLTGKYGWGKPVESGTKIITTGYVEEADLAALYSGCHVFVYPSLYEGFGLPILEAMACGAPVITSNNSSMLEIAKDVAILVDPRNKAQLAKAIRFVLDLNLDNYQKFVRASLDRARKFSWSKTAKETLQVYKDVAKASV